ncbi:Bsd2p [Sporobolomyces koalae]|uniref:Bsd2p n=1 Tax=Sporobolomyces koalae TaxID=500713 RepID=UPI00317EA4BF
MSSHRPHFTAGPLADFTASFNLTDPEEDRDDRDDRVPQHLAQHHPDTPPHESAIPSARLASYASPGADRHPSSPPMTSVRGALSSTSTQQADGVTIPGGYDFEPQAYEGGAGGSSSRHAGTFPAESGSRPRFDLPPSRSITARESIEDNGAEIRQTNRASRPGRLDWRALVSRFGPAGRATDRSDRSATHAGEEHRLLFSHDDSDDTDADYHRREAESSLYPPRNIHLPLPPRPPAFATASTAAESAPESSSMSIRNPGGKIYGGGAKNDGVFSNLAAKPDGAANVDFVGDGPDKDEVLPAYEAAALDSTPPYWETTVITAGGFLGPDDICVDGMPVGNLFSFAWNLLVSMSFQFVGFLLTYLLHTTHAAKNGSRAGLGITLIQLGFYLKQHTDHSADPVPGGGTVQDDTALSSGTKSNLESVRWSWWGSTEIEEVESPLPSSTLAAALGNLPTQASQGLSSMLNASNSRVDLSGGPSLIGNGVSEAELNSMSMDTNEWMSFALVTVGSFLLIGGCLSYWRAVRYARALRQGTGPGADAESTVA